jgi:hypothetical protein
VGTTFRKETMTSTAIISECGKYREELTRTWDPTLPTLYWVMLNPSTADALKDDPTIRKCVGFAKLNGFGSIIVYNLSTFRATDPKELIARRGFDDTTGPNTDMRLASIPQDATVVCAWGSFPYAQPSLHHRTRVALSLLDGRRLTCVKKTEDRPWHPLYVKYGSLIEYPGTV